MKIGIVCYPTFGGSGVVATELGSWMARQGCDVHFITYSQPVRLDMLQGNIYYHEVNVHDYPLFQYQPYELALSSKMVDTVVREKLDLLHVHYAIPHAYAAYMAKQILADRGIHIPVVTTLHGTDITLVGRNPSYSPAVTFSIEHSDAVTAVSESLRRETVQLFGIQRPIQVIPNFVEMDRYGTPDPEQRALLARPDQKLVVHISNFRKVKRIPDVIEIFHRLHQNVPARLIMVGDGPEREPAEDQIRALGLEHDAVFVGKMAEVEKILVHADLFLLPSEMESFGLSALEAMAAGVPVVASLAGGICEVVQNGVTGYTAPIGDVTQMAEYATQILTDPELAHRFSVAAKKRASEFSIEKIAHQYYDVYLPLVAQGAPCSESK
jgi:N-acetyl-alpha-D-glucosaminyl L-malate synthase BshA